MGEYGRVLFMRHPRTVFNDTGLLSGHIDVELSEAASPRRTAPPLP